MPNRTKTIELEHKQYVTPARLGIMFLILLSFVSGWMLTQYNPVIIIGMVGVIVYMAILFFWPYIGVLVYLVFEYARLPAMFPALQVLQVGKLIAVPTLLMLLIRVFIVRDRKLVFDNVILFLIVWLMLAVIGAPFAINSAVWGAIFTLLKWFIICFLIVNLVTSLPKFQYFVWFLLLLNLKMSQHQIRSFYYGYQQVAATYRDFFISQGVGSGSTSFFANATDFGLAMVVVVPLALYLIPSVRSKILKVFAGGTLAAFITSILKSGSRGAAVAMFAMTGLYWFKSKNKLILIVVLAIFVMIFWSMAPEAWQERFVSIGDYQEDATAMQRVELWKAGINIFLDHPVFGVGIDQYGWAFEAGYRPANYRGATAAHSIFIQAAAELGIGGFIILLIILFALFKRNWETRQLYIKAKLNERWLWYFSLALDLSLAGFIVGGAFLTVLYYPHLYMILAMIVSLHYITKNKAAKAAGGINIGHV